jgi:hypothetical protein
VRSSRFWSSEGVYQRGFRGADCKGARYGIRNDADGRLWPSVRPEIVIHIEHELVYRHTGQVIIWHIADIQFETPGLQMTFVLFSWKRLKSVFVLRFRSERCFVCRVQADRGRSITKTPSTMRTPPVVRLAILEWMRVRVLRKCSAISATAFDDDFPQIPKGRPSAGYGRSLNAEANSIPLLAGISASTSNPHYKLTAI